MDQPILMWPKKHNQKGISYYDIIYGISFSISIRALYGTNEQRNAVHGSDSAVSAEREIRFFFPNCKFKIRYILVN